MAMGAHQSARMADDLERGAELAQRVGVFLVRIEDALRSLDADALGMGESGGAEWPIRDELADSARMLTAQLRAYLSSLSKSEGT